MRATKMQSAMMGYQLQAESTSSRKTVAQVDADVFASFARMTGATVRAPVASDDDAECARIAGQLASRENADLAHMRACVADRSEQW